MTTPAIPSTTEPTALLGAVANPDQIHLDGGAIAKIRDLARAAMPVIALEKHKAVAVVPLGFSLSPIPEVDVERDAPRRINVRHVVETMESFVAYLERFKQASTIVYGTAAKAEMMAVIDHFEVSKPAYADHRCTLKPRYSDSFKAWFAINGKPLNQIQMTRFLEENYIDITAPAGATMLEIAMSIEASKTGSFRSSVRLANGSHQLTYDEKVDGKAGSETNRLVIPEKVVLFLAVFEGQAGREVHAHFRYNTDGGKLVLQFDLWRLAQVVREAFADLVKDLTTATALRVIDGTFDEPKRIDAPAR